MNHQRIQQSARALRLSGLLQSLDVRLQEAATHQLSHAEFLDLIFQDELVVRDSRAVERRKDNARFRDLRTLEDFDFSFNESIQRSQIYELATCRFISEGSDVLFIGPPGVGKSHLAQALGLQAVRQGHTVLYASVFDLVRDLVEEEEIPGVRSKLAKYLKCDLLIIDDMGIKQLPARSGEYLFEIIMRRYEKRSTIMTSNRPLEEWGKLIGDVPAATAILDRFLHHARIIRITGKSYRLKDRAEATTKPKESKSAISTAGNSTTKNLANTPNIS